MTPNGIGLGLRVDMARQLLEEVPSLAFVEVHPENYMERGGLYREFLHQAREHYPIVTHGLTMCFGQTEPHDRAFLDGLRDFLKEVGTPWHSDHLCFGGAAGVFAHDLLPIPFTEEARDIVVQRLTEARDRLDVELAFENVSYYAAQGDDPLDEARFCVEVLERADARIMLDVNNVFVNSQNFGFDPKAWIDMIPPERVVQMHVAGHLLRPDGLRIDTHGEPVPDGVYELLEYTLKRMGPKPVLLERDNNIPPLEELLAEVARLQEIYARAVA
ncbi:MAG: DUF692 domain-containing protein [Myxococcota bacterium]